MVPTDERELELVYEAMRSLININSGWLVPIRGAVSPRPLAVVNEVA